MKTLKLEEISLDGGTQTREKLHEETIAEYASIYQDGGSLPPAEVVFDGAAYWLWEGFHRYHARARAGLGTLDVNVTKGTQRDAILKACGANSEHGLKRTNKDKRKAVALLLKDKEWSGKSDRWIADQCKVGHPLVAEIRHSLNGKSQAPKSPKSPNELEEIPVDQKDQCSSDIQKREGKDGKVRQSPAKESSGHPVRDYFDNGKPKFNEQRLTKCMGDALRAVDDRKNTCGGGSYHTSIVNLMRTVEKILNAWRTEKDVPSGVSTQLALLHEAAKGWRSRA